MSLAARLRAALATGLARPTVLLPGDGLDPDADPDPVLTPAAVLVAVTDRPRPGVILTVRTAHLRQHSGQVAFPGGRIDPEDAGPAAAALREAEEEIGLPRAAAALVGLADPYRTITGYRVTPVLAVVPADLPLVPHEHEVADIFEAPLDHLLDPAQHQLRTAEFRGAQRTYYEIAWQDRRIWGATAAMLVNLSRRLAP